MIPVIVLQRVEDAVPLAAALVAGGVRVLEVTLRTPVALACMEAIARAVPEALVGAGTIRSRRRCARGQGRRLRLRRQPGLHGRGRRGLPRDRPAAAARRGHRQRGDGGAGRRAVDFLKFFPATAAGGIPMLKALAGPFPDVVFCPTGGITPETAPQFLALPNVKVCGGSWLTPADAVAAGDWARITQALAAATAGALKLRA